jgi:hypothetical protein
MSIIDPSGLFGGDRLRRCSNIAQLHWPRLFLASDGYGRIEINYARIVGKAYPGFNPIPSETELQAFIQEYVDNFLLFPYQAGGQLWGQWDTRSELLPRYKTSADRRSPHPPELAFTQWKQLYSAEQKAFPKSFGKLAATFLHGGGVGVGVGYLKACSPGGERTSDFTQENKPDAALNGKTGQQQDSAWGTKERSAVFNHSFWPPWPRKVAKAAAEKAWLKHASSPELATQIVQAVRDQTPMLTVDGIKFCPHAATWLNDRRYTDDPTEAAATSAVLTKPAPPEWEPPWEANHG